MELAAIDQAEAARSDYNLSPSRFVSANDEEPVLPLEEAVVLLREAEEERQTTDSQLWRVLNELGIFRVNEGDTNARSYER
jgi:type I restriction enzyme M protein